MISQCKREGFHEGCGMATNWQPVQVSTEMTNIQVIDLRQTQEEEEVNTQGQEQMDVMQRPTELWAQEKSDRKGSRAAKAQNKSDKKENHQNVAASKVQNEDTKNRDKEGTQEVQIITEHLDGKVKTVKKHTNEESTYFEETQGNAQHEKVDNREEPEEHSTIKEGGKRQRCAGGEEEKKRRNASRETGSASHNYKREQTWQPREGQGRRLIPKQPQGTRK